MASSQIGQLRVALSLGTAEFEAGAAKAATVAKSRAKEIESSFAGAKAAVSGLFAAFTVGLLTEQIKKSLDYAGSLAEVSRTLGVTTKDLQTFRFAATQSGVAQDQLEVGLRRLTVSMGKAELGSKEQAKAFQAIGISVDQLKGKNTGDVFRLMADGLEKVRDRSQRAAIEMTLMGRSGSTLDNLLAPGSKRLNELADAAQRLGIVLSDSQIQGAEETAHKLEAVKQVLAAQIAGVVANNANAILSLSSALATLTGQIIKFLGSNPQLALGIVGALLGGRVGGLPGAVLGGAAGAVLGGKLAQSQLDSSTDLTVRTQQMREAQKAYFESQKTHFDPRTGVVVQPTARSVQAAKDAWIDQIHRLQQATAQSRSFNAPAVAGVGLPKIFGGDKKPKKGPEDKNEEDAFQFAQQQRQIDLQILDAKKALSHDYVEQTTLSIQQLDVQKAITNADLDHKLTQAAKDLADHKITQAIYDQLKAETDATKLKEDQLDHLKRQAVLDAEQEQRFRDTAHLNDLDLELQKQKLQLEDNLAQTAKQRRDIELRLLDLSYQQEKARLEAVEADKQSTDAEKEDARRRLAALNGQYGLQRQNVINSTMGPLEQWAKSVPHDAATINEALQSIQVQGLDGLSTAISDVITGTRSLKDAFGQLAKSIIADLIQMTVKMLIFRALTTILGGSFGGAKVAQDSAPFVPSTPGFATGGSFMIGGLPGTDRNMLALNGVPIARVGRGETLSVDPNGARSGDVTIHQTFKFEGVAITQAQFVQGLMAAKQSTIDAIRERNRRR